MYYHLRSDAMRWNVFTDNIKYHVFFICYCGMIMFAGYLLQPFVSPCATVMVGIAIMTLAALLIFMRICIDLNHHGILVPIVRDCIISFMMSMLGIILLIVNKIMITHEHGDISFGPYCVTPPYIIGSLYLFVLAALMLIRSYPCRVEYNIYK